MRRLVIVLGIALALPSVNAVWAQGIPGLPVPANVPPAKRPQNNGAAFLARPPTPTPATPVPTPTCNGASVGGFCWFAGQGAENCDTVCANNNANGFYDDATRTYAGSEGTGEQCEQVLVALAIPYQEFQPNSICSPGSSGLGCAFRTFTATGIRCLTPPTTSDASSDQGSCGGPCPEVRRMCACRVSRCGDGVCDGSENCESCLQDCSCPTGQFCRNSECVCAGHTFSFHIDSTAGQTVVPAQWPGGSEEQCNGPCCVRGTRPDGVVSALPGPGAVPWGFTIVSGYAACGITVVNNPQCSELTASSGFVTSNRPICTNALCTNCTGFAHDDMELSCVE
jgi:hypothetical protein